MATTQCEKGFWIDISANLSPTNNHWPCISVWWHGCLIHCVCYAVFNNIVNKYSIGLMVPLHCFFGADVCASSCFRLLLTTPCCVPSTPCIVVSFSIVCERDNVSNTGNSIKIHQILCQYVTLHQFIIGCLRFHSDTAATTNENQYHNLSESIIMEHFF